MKLYIVLNNEKRGIYNGITYDINNPVLCGDDLPSKYWHKCLPLEGLIGWFRHTQKDRVFEVVTWGDNIIHNLFDQKYKNFRFLREIPYRELKQLAKNAEDRVNFNLEEALFPVNPLSIIHKLISNEDIFNLEEWIKMYEKLDDMSIIPKDLTINDLFLQDDNMLKDVTMEMVYNFIRTSVTLALWQPLINDLNRTYECGIALEVYISSILVQHSWNDKKKEIYPFECLLNLWYRGLIPTFNNKTWRLHSGEKRLITFPTVKYELVKNGDSL